MQLREHLAALTAEPDSPTVLQHFFPHSDTFIALWAVHQHVAGFNGSFLFHDAAFLTSLGGFGMPFDKVDTLHDNLVSIEFHFQNLTHLPSIITGYHDHRIALADPHSICLPEEKLLPNNLLKHFRSQ
jgi:hypothetical protein